ncbi:hypothetical protein C2845_PM09G10990 [Panicum miliaceum]|uniref:Uncharacterized protein n=1 Tax=Panicum miliaceum TaxID=4540 RepID=A0A3L6S246_PANMI|nr:hypothetical protein C2845_PM09G10990 [Panicum miliaceum]
MGTGARAHGTGVVPSRTTPAASAAGSTPTGVFTLPPGSPAGHGKDEREGCGHVVVVRVSGGGREHPTPGFCPLARGAGELGKERVDVAGPAGPGEEEHMAVHVLPQGSRPAPAPRVATPPPARFTPIMRARARVAARPLARGGTARHGTEPRWHERGEPAAGAVEGLLA